MSTAHDEPSALPRDAQSILALAARSLFERFANASEGMLLVDKAARVVWINDQYRRFLPALGFAQEQDFVGHAVSSVVQNTQLHKVLETGKPILIDLLTNKAGTFLVSRIPLLGDAGEVIGALGIVLFDHAEVNLAPLMAKFTLLQRELDDARAELAVQRNRGGAEGSLLRQAKHSFASFVGTSPAAVEAKRQGRRAAQSTSPVLLLGETGTGKELLAHAIHGASSRSRSPLVSVNIAAVPDNLLEAEFFGVAPGAYTGADRKPREGKFKLADGGTLFLDEIGDMPLHLQAKLLRALQEGEIEPLGSNKIVTFNARVIAATSRDLAAMVQGGRFREDLYYRLNVLSIRVPPLRERTSDVAALVEVLCDDIASRNQVQPCELSAQAVALLAQQHWRGNIRELRNVLEQAAMHSDTGSIGEADIAAVLSAQLGFAVRRDVAPAINAPAPDCAPDLRPLAVQVTQLEIRAIDAAMLACGANKTAAARMLGISRATLYGRLGLPSSD